MNVVGPNPVRQAGGRHSNGPACTSAGRGGLAGDRFGGPTPDAQAAGALALVVRGIGGKGGSGAAVSCARVHEHGQGNPGTLAGLSNHGSMP